MNTETDKGEDDWLTKVSKNPIIAWFFVRDKGAKYLNPLTLNFEKQYSDLEKKYVTFQIESNIFFGVVGCIVGALLYLAYIVLDLAFPDNFIQLLCIRIGSAMLILSLVFAVLFIKQVRRHANYYATVVLCLAIATGSYALILRDDIDFSPFFMSLLWVNMHYGPYLIVERTITGLILILAYTLTWIFYVHAEPLTLLNTQTLTYVMFFAGAVLSAYGREVTTRHVYLQIYNLYNSIKESPAFANLSVPPSPAISRSTTLSTIPPISSPLDNSDSPNLTFSLSPTSLVSSDPTDASVTEGFNSILLVPSRPLSSSSSSSVAPAPASAPPSPCLSPLSSSSTSISASPTSSPSPATRFLQHRSSSLYPFSLSPTPPSQQFLRERDWFDDLHDKASNIISSCFPVKRGSVVKDLHYHKEVQKYINMRSFRSQKFCDPDREEKFSTWHRHTTEASVYIVSTVILITHDLSFDLNSSELSIILGLRFGVILPSLLLFFFLGSILPRTMKYRTYFNSLLELICTATSFIVGYLIWRFVSDTDEVEGYAAYDLYFGITSRYLIYGFSGMGLRWIPCSIIGGGLTLLFVIVGAGMGFSLSFFNIFVGVVGIFIAYAEERVKRIEFVMHHFKDEIISHWEVKVISNMVRGSLNVVVQLDDADTK